MNIEALISQPGSDPIELETLIMAPCERLFRAWTDPNEVPKWFGLRAGAMVSAEIDLRVGGHWRYVMHETNESRRVLHGTYTAIKEGRQLSYTWQYVEERKDGTQTASGVSQVEVDFAPEGKATRLKLKHSAIEAQDSRLGVGEGWAASFRSLAVLVE